ncbi:MAG: Holliday junction branch migration protein RuvA, partial [Chlamydiales bacterium]
MYEFIRGKLATVNSLYIVIEAYGIGYKLAIPLNHLRKLPPLGETLFLYTAWVVRENSQALYGFLTQKERDLFEILLALSGIGPKTALGIMGHVELSELEKAVLANNSNVFTKVPGVGKKTADRLIIDLKGRLSLSSSIHPSTKQQDALNALIHLGYTQAIA